MGGASSKFEITDWDKADGGLQKASETIDGADPTSMFGIYYVTRQGINQRDFQVMDEESNRLYTTRAVPGTLAWFDVLGTTGVKEEECHLLRVQVDIARRYWTVYRYGVPTFEGQAGDMEATSHLTKKQEVPGKGIPVLYKVCCIVVSWSRFTAISILYGPPPDFSDNASRNDGESAGDENRTSEAEPDANLPLGIRENGAEERHATAEPGKRRPSASSELPPCGGHEGTIGASGDMEDREESDSRERSVFSSWFRSTKSSRQDEVTTALSTDISSTKDSVATSPPTDNSDRAATTNHSSPGEHPPKHSCSTKPIEGIPCSDVPEPRSCQSDKVCVHGQGGVDLTVEKSESNAFSEVRESEFVVDSQRGGSGEVASGISEGVGSTKGQESGDIVEERNQGDDAAPAGGQGTEEEQRPSPQTFLGSWFQSKSSKQDAISRVEPSTKTPENGPSIEEGINKGETSVFGPSQESIDDQQSSRSTGNPVRRLSGSFRYSSWFRRDQTESSRGYSEGDGRDPNPTAECENGTPADVPLDSVESDTAAAIAADNGNNRADVDESVTKSSGYYRRMSWLRRYTSSLPTEQATNPAEGVFCPTKPILQCQEIYTLVGNHQTSRLSREKATELLRIDAAGHVPEATDELGSVGDDLLLGALELSKTDSETRNRDSGGAPQTPEADGVGLNVPEQADSEDQKHSPDDLHQDRSMLVEEPAEDDLTPQFSEEEEPLVGYWKWEHSLRVRKIKMYLAQGTDLALHVVLAIIVNQVRCERNAIAVAI